MPIVNKTDYTSDMYKECFDRDIRGRRRGLLIAGVFCSVAGILIGGLLCTTGFGTVSTWSGLVDGIPIIIMSQSLLLYLLILRSSLARNARKMAVSLSYLNICSTYTFHENHIDIVSIVHKGSPNQDARQTDISYEKIRLVRETANAYYLLISKKSSCISFISKKSPSILIVSRAGFTQGTEEELVALLRKNIPAHKWKLD